MAATLIDGKAIAAQVRAGVAEEVERFLAAHSRPPGLATVLVGDDPASAVYVAAKQRACKEAGIVPFDRRLPAEVSSEELAEELDSLNSDRAVSGILLQLPVPDP